MTAKQKCACVWCNHCKWTKDSRNEILRKGDPFPISPAGTRFTMQQWLILSASVIYSDHMVHWSGLFNAFMPFNSLGPSEAIWRWGSWSTLVQVMAWCRQAPSHCLNQCWLIISKVLWHLSGALSYEDLRIPISKARLKITFLKSY